ncbi:MAG: hypothetical protein R3C60_02740 [Parvularculaceae bacterium]
MTTRRSLLKAGAGFILVSGAGISAYSLTRSPAKAIEPWRRAGQSFGDSRLDALSYAILAPNPHNMQPWRVELEGTNALTIYADLARLLPETDPPNRQITIGFGCFLELLRQAAADKGLACNVTPFPEGEPHPVLDERPIAHVKFMPNAAEADPLFSTTLERRTNRATFTSRAIEPEKMGEILAASIPGVDAAGAISGDMIDTLRALASEAWKIEWDLKRTRDESIRVTRIGKAEINDAPWGLALSNVMMNALHDASVLTREKMDKPGDSAFSQSREFYLRLCESAAGFVWTTTAENTRRDQLAAGAAWVRMNQTATQAGLAFHPLSQALQEFPEMAAPYARIHALLARNSGATVQMLARIGYAKTPPPSPREPLEAKLIPV